MWTVFTAVTDRVAKWNRAVAAGKQQTARVPGGLGSSWCISMGEDRSGASCPLPL
jgi:hypothetical protein